MHVLIADDSEDVRLVLEHILKSSGFSVTTAVDGRAALDSARANPPDLIISDIMMPHIDGFELCRQLKNDFHLAKIPIIFYTASFLEEQDRQLAQALGVAEFIVKPLDAPAILAIINKVISHPNAYPPPTPTAVLQPRLHIDEMYVKSVGRKLDEKVVELELEREALKKSEEKFRTIFNSISDAIFIQDITSGAILSTNETMLSMYGYTEEEVVQLEVDSLSAGTPPYSAKEAAAFMQKAAAGKPQIFDWLAQHKSGRLFWVGVSMTKAVIEGHERFLVVVRDINERKQAEQQRLELEAKLRQKYKMEAIGVMAGGVAHDFNNKLAIILGNIEFAQLKVDPYSQITAPLQNAKIATLRARDLVKQILAYSRQSNHSLKPINPALIMEETFTLLRATIPTTIAMETQLDPGNITINGDSTQLQEVLINLCNNAVHAMNGKGVLNMKLEQLDASKMSIPAQYEQTTNKYAKITVADDGAGIAPEIMEKIFDPFFTTKGLAEGTGMGLAVVQGIIDSHHGFMTVHSTLGQGTTFELYLPTVAARYQPRPIIPIAAAELPRGKEKILVVDDEEKLARIMSRILSEYGYQVTTLTSSSAALAQIKANPAEFDLVITDQSMPELSGTDLINEILKIRSDMPVVLCTGYSSMVNEEEATKIGISAFCMKPLDMDQLIKTTRRVLDSAGLT
jgi:PAS domain S-box-containing protein